MHHLIVRMQYLLFLQFLNMVLGSFYNPYSPYPSPSDYERVSLLTQNISDNFERTVMATQMLYCPMFPMCRHLEWVKNYSDGVLTYFGSCCEKIKTGDICSEDKPDTSVSCVLPQYKHWSNVVADEAYSMRTECSKNFQGKYVIGRCTEQIDPTDLSLFIPVYSRASGKVYKNIDCGLCNFEKQDDTEMWIAKVLCKNSMPFSSPPQSEREMLEFIQKDFNCNILFYENNYNVSTCDWIRFSKCNQTGRWRKYDETIERACHRYTSVYRRYYKNVFCFLCNEDQEPNVRCDETHITTGGKPDLGSFSALLRYRTEPQKIELHTPDTCDDSSVYIASEEKCRKIFCPPFCKYNASSQSCDPIFEKASNVKYIVYYNITIYYNNQASSLDSIGIDRGHFLHHVVQDNILRDLIGEYSTVYTSPEILQYLPDDVLHKHSFVLHIEFTEYGLHDQRQYLKIMTTLPNIRIKYNAKNISVVLQVLSPKTVEDGNKSSMAEFLILGSFLSEPASTVVVTQNYFCPMIKIERNRTSLPEGDLPAVDFKKVRYKTEESKSSKENVMVCLKQYIEAIPSTATEQPTTKSYTIEQVLSLVGSTISIVSLICLLLVYAVCKELRTIPGINNIILACHLIVANILYLFGFKSTVNFTLCVAVGICIHYVWMASIMWMHICSVHMFRVFVFMMKNPNANYSKRVILFYALYANVISIIFVCVNVIFYFASQQKEGYLGYGGNRCYITIPDMVLYTFAIPVGCILISNIILFCVVIFYVQRLPEVSSTHGKNRNTFLIYTKLSCLTGITWIFGYIYQWTFIKEFSYVFIALNASQGLFMFLSFGCTKRVRRICCSKLSTSQTKASTNESKLSTPLTIRSS